ncbi:MAG: molybdopterin molybdotransferase MoeA [Gammaproteobacteria bacterium]
MTQDKPIPQPGCDDYDPNSLTVEQAMSRIAESVEPIDGAESVALRAALGRTLDEAVLSPIDVPPYTNSAMDGYALRGADLPDQGEARLQVVGTALAGQPFEGGIGAGQCVRIMTGAKMPEGTDTVVMQEHTEREDDTVRIGSGHRPGQNVRAAGEDLARGKPVLSRGKRLGPADIGLLASLGVPEVRVKRRLRVAFFSTGDELRSLGEPLEEGQIYDSNRYTLYGLLSELGVELIDMGVVRDRREDVEAAFEQAAGTADAVITSGGVSVGEADYVKDTLERLGQVGFWKIAMKPGRPLAFGRVGRAYFFGLPGNPVSVMATFYELVLPALRRLMGQEHTQPVSLTVPCAERLKKRPGRVDFQRGILTREADGTLAVRSTGAQGSHILSSMSRANCFIVLPSDWGDVEPGTQVEVQPFEGLL